MVCGKFRAIGLGDGATENDHLYLDYLYVLRLYLGILKDIKRERGGGEGEVEGEYTCIFIFLSSSLIASSVDRHQCRFFPTKIFPPKKNPAIFFPPNFFPPFPPRQFFPRHFLTRHFFPAIFVTLSALDPHLSWACGDT